MQRPVGPVSRATAPTRERADCSSTSCGRSGGHVTRSVAVAVPSWMRPSRAAGPPPRSVRPAHQRRTASGDVYNLGSSDPDPMSTLPSPAAQAFGETPAEDQHLTAEEAPPRLEACLHRVLAEAARHREARRSRCRVTSSRTKQPHPTGRSKQFRRPGGGSSGSPRFLDQLFAKRGPPACLCTGRRLDADVLLADAQGPHRVRPREQAALTASTNFLRRFVTTPLAALDLRIDVLLPEEELPRDRQSVRARLHPRPDRLDVAGDLPESAHLAPGDGAPDRRREVGDQALHHRAPDARIRARSPATSSRSRRGCSRARTDCRSRVKFFSVKQDVDAQVESRELLGHEAAQEVGRPRSAPPASRGRTR